MRKKIRICFVSMQRIFETIGGIEGYTKRLCRVLGNYGFESYIVSRSIGKLTPQVYTDCSEDFKKQKPESYRKLPKGSEYIYLVSLIMFSFLLFLRLLSEIRNRRLNIVHAQDPFFSGFPAVLAGHLTNRPAIVHCHGSHSLPTQDQQKTPSWIILRMFYKLTTMIGKNFFATDSITEKALIAEGVNPEHCVVIPTFVEEEYFLLSPQKSTRIGVPYSVGYIGRLAKIKRVDTLIEAIRILKEKNIEIKSFIVGTGDEKDNLIRQVTRSAIIENVEFLGAMADVSNFLQMIDVFVLPSESEGCPLALLESMAAGVPSVISDIRPIRSMFDDSELGFFRVGDAQHLASVIEEILLNEELWYELSMNGRKKAESFSTENIVSEMSLYYHRML